VEPKLTLERLKALTEPFEPNAHKERKLPGGGRWLFVPWQAIRTRIHKVDPDWSCSYTDPIVCGNHTVIRCQLTIFGVTRERVGNSEAYPDKKGYGTPIEIACADAFKNAAENFGIAAYLDNQAFTIDYLHKKGDNRPFKFASEAK
jgi:hypothetical protein